MKNVTVIIILTVASLTSGISQLINYQLSESALSWKGKAAFSKYYLSGTLTTQSSEVKIDDGKIIDAFIIIDMLSLHAENDQLKAHLRSEDFFEVEKYTRSTFYLSEEASISANETLLTGDLTLKNKTLPIDVLATINLDNETLKVFGKFIIDRTSFGIYYNSPNFFENLKEQAIDDHFELEFALTYKKK